MNLQRKDIPLPDFQQCNDRIHAKVSKVNVSYCWLEYKQDNPDGYEQSQFYELYNRFEEKNFGKREAKMAVERVPSEKSNRLGRLLVVPCNNFEHLFMQMPSLTRNYKVSLQELHMRNGMHPSGMVM